MTGKSLLNRRILLAAFAPALVIAVSGCPAQDLTVAEAREAIQEVSLASEAAQMAEGTVELTTSFTIGGAVEEAAEEIAEFVRVQMPCAEVTLDGSTVTIEYGALPGDCTYNGHTFSGSHTISLTKNDESEVLVQHAWDQISNGRIEVSGFADVTWNLDDESRHVVHELEWTRLSNGKTVVGSGDRMQRPLDGDWRNGITVEGERAWEGPRGTWELDIDGAEMRWIDPVPQAGTYTLTTPRDKTLSATFDRVDEDTIRVTVAGAKRDFSFLISKAGTITDDPNNAED